MKMCELIKNVWKMWDFQVKCVKLGRSVSPAPKCFPHRLKIGLIRLIKVNIPHCNSCAVPGNTHTPTVDFLFLTPTATPLEFLF